MVQPNQVLREAASRLHHTITLLYNFDVSIKQNKFHNYCPCALLTGKFLTSIKRMSRKQYIFLLSTRVSVQFCADKRPFTLWTSYCVHMRTKFNKNAFQSRNTNITKPPFTVDRKFKF